MFSQAAVLVGPGVSRRSMADNNPADPGGAWEDRTAQLFLLDEGFFTLAGMENPEA
ncbi:MAG: hypothetical protein WBH63_04030 [Bacillota bacterium]